MLDLAERISECFRGRAPNTDCRSDRYANRECNRERNRQRGAARPDSSSHGRPAV